MKLSPCEQKFKTYGGTIYNNMENFNWNQLQNGSDIR
ncbi:hypothetical protein GLO73106DRAFT_00040320, partial [Gloeocapsa sp. PCC 73106]